MEKYIIEKLRLGDEQAFRYIYDCHYILLCRFAYQLLDDVALAEEIVQKVLEDDGYNFIAHLKVSFLMKNNVVGFNAHPTDYYQFNKDTYIQ